MAEPESAVLPITPYPIGCLKQLVKASRRQCEGRAAAAASRYGPTCRLPNNPVASHPRPIRALARAVTFGVGVPEQRRANQADMRDAIGDG
jgi:hypothetical protein